MPKKSAGILLFRRDKKRLLVFLVHPGGPFWKNKDEGAWSIPKGELDNEEDLLVAALREMKEETGIEPEGPYIELHPQKQKSGKLIYAFAAESKRTEITINSNLFEMEWPPRSGKMQSFPEVDRGSWFSLEEARAKLVSGQVPFIDQLEQIDLAHE